MDIRFFVHPLLFIYLFFSSCWNKWKIFLSSPPFLSHIFFLFSLSLCVEIVESFLLSPLAFFPFFSFSWDNNVILARKRNIFLCNKVTQICSKESARALQEAIFIFFGIDTQNQPEPGDNCKLKVKGIFASSVVAHAHLCVCYCNGELAKAQRRFSFPFFVGILMMHIIKPTKFFLFLFFFWQSWGWKSLLQTKGRVELFMASKCLFSILWYH